MFRIDSEGATLDNKFTEGDPSLGVPATVVSADWLNSVQEEIAHVVEENDITLNKAQNGQLMTALLEFFLRGGRKTPLDQNLANDQAVTDVDGFEFDATKVKCKICFYDIERKTTTQNKQESGILFITRDTNDSEWRLSLFSLFDNDSGVTLSATNSPTGKLQYATSDLTGASYEGHLKITSILEIRI